MLHVERNSCRTQYAAAVWWWRSWPLLQSAVSGSQGALIFYMLFGINAPYIYTFEPVYRDCATL